MGKKVDYLDMSIPFDDLPMPKSKSDWKMYKKRHKKEFVEPYEFMKWYDVLKIPFWCLKLPTTDDEQAKYVKRFNSEYGDGFELSPWVDPIYDDNSTDRNEFETKLERSFRKRNLMIAYCRAIHENDIDRIAEIKSLLEQESCVSDE